MTGSLAVPHTPLEYDQAAADYFGSLPLEHFMEPEAQAIQRGITLAGFTILKKSQPDVQLFSELLVQYAHDGRLRRVVPDNMVVLSETDAPLRKSYNLELEPAPLWMVIEYVSSDKAKDYEESFQEYERELLVPYCVLFDPERQDLQVYRHDGERYVRLEPDLEGRCSIEELDLKVGIRDRWLRYWCAGELLPLTEELADEVQQQAQQLEQQARQLNRQARQLNQQARELRERAQQVCDFRSQTDEAIQVLRREVEVRASSHGRTDILHQLGSVSDVGQLGRWLAELP
jgi:hypothetical protein